MPFKQSLFLLAPEDFSSLPTPSPNNPWETQGSSLTSLGASTMEAKKGSSQVRELPKTPAILYKEPGLDEFFFFGKIKGIVRLQLL